MNLWGLCRSFFMLHFICFILCIFVTHLTYFLLSLSTYVYVCVCVLNYDHNKTLCILIKNRQKNTLSIDWRKQKRKKTKVNVQNISAHWILDKCRLTYFLCFAIWCCRSHISKNEIQKNERLRTGNGNIVAETKNQFTRLAIVDVYLTCSQTKPSNQPASQPIHYRTHVQCLHICNCRLSQEVTSYCRFKMYSFFPFVARFLIIIYGNNCYFYNDEKRATDCQFGPFGWLVGAFRIVIGVALQ